MPFRSAAIEAQNTFTTAMQVVRSNGNGCREFTISIWGTFSATVTVQRSFDGGTTWLDVAQYTVPVEDFGSEPTDALYRIGVKTGEYTSGTVNVRIGA